MMRQFEYGTTDGWRGAIKNSVSRYRQTSEIARYCLVRHCVDTLPILSCDRLYVMHKWNAHQRRGTQYSTVQYCTVAYVAPSLFETAHLCKFFSATQPSMSTAPITEMTTHNSDENSVTIDCRIGVWIMDSQAIHDSLRSWCWLSCCITAYLGLNQRPFSQNHNEYQTSLSISAHSLMPINASL